MILEAVEFFLEDMEVFKPGRKKLTSMILLRECYRWNRELWVNLQVHIIVFMEALGFWKDVRLFGCAIVESMCDIGAHSRYYL